MRSDMPKLIVERGRILSRRVKRRPSRDPDALPDRESMRRRHVLARSENAFSDNLAPLRRYLMKQVGRPWNKVYGEICAPIRRSSTVQDHVRLHIEDFVSTRVAMRDGVPVDLASRWGSRAVRLLYVDPRTGILRLNRNNSRIGGKSVRSAPAANDPSHIVVGREQELIRIDGIWYWLAFATASPPEAAPLGGGEPRRAKDILTDNEVSEGRYRAGKRQASARDLRRLGLSNAIGAQ